MKGKVVGGIVAGALLILLVSTHDGRPNEREAKKLFEQAYPGVQVISVKVAMDEVVARSFVFKYRKPGSTSEKEIEVQFMERDNGKWLLSPTPELK